MKKGNEGCRECKDTVLAKKEESKKPSKKDRKWETPLLEDVSGRVMAQPYIRFT